MLGTLSLMEDIYFNINLMLFSFFFYNFRHTLFLPRQVPATVVGRQEVEICLGKDEGASTVLFAPLFFRESAGIQGTSFSLPSWVRTQNTCRGRERPRCRRPIRTWRAGYAISGKVHTFLPAEEIIKVRIHPHHLSPPPPYSIIYSSNTNRANIPH